MARIKVQGIYKIENTHTGKVYVGSGMSVHDRKYVHFQRLKKGNHHSVKLQRSYDKYGVDAFVFSVIEIVAREDDLIPREQHWIDTLKGYKNGYNACAVAGRTVGYKFSEDHRRRQSERMKSFEFTDEHKANISKALKGHRLSDETKAKISASNRKAFECPEARRKISVANSGRIPGADVREKMSRAQKASWTPERRAAQSEKASSRTHTAESKAKIAENNRRRHISPETKEKLRQAAIKGGQMRKAAKEAANGCQVAAE